MDNKVDAVLELTQTGFKSRCRLKIGLDFDRDIKRVMLPPSLLLSIIVLLLVSTSTPYLDLYIYSNRILGHI